MRAQSRAAVRPRRRARGPCAQSRRRRRCSSAAARRPSRARSFLSRAPRRPSSLPPAPPAIASRPPAGPVVAKAPAGAAAPRVQWSWLRRPRRRGGQAPGAAPALREAQPRPGEPPRHPSTGAPVRSRSPRRPQRLPYLHPRRLPLPRQPADCCSCSRRSSNLLLSAEPAAVTCRLEAPAAAAEIDTQTLAIAAVIDAPAHVPAHRGQGHALAASPPAPRRPRAAW